MNRLYAGYVRQIGRCLRCSRKARLRLLQGLEEELEEALSQEEGISLDQLKARFGPPAKVAAELQATLPPEEEEQCTLRRRRVGRLVLALCGVLIVGLVGFIVCMACSDVAAITTQIVYY